MVQNAINPLPDNRFSPSPNHNLLLFLTNSCLPNFSIKFNQHSFLCFCDLCLCLSQLPHLVTTTGLQIGFLSVAFFPLSCHWPIPSHCMSSTRSVGPRDFFSLAHINYPATQRYILNVTFLMFSHVSCLPPTISPLFRCKSVSRVGLHNGWDRLTVQLMIIWTHTARGAALIRFQMTDCLHGRIEDFSENYTLTQYNWSLCQTMLCPACWWDAASTKVLLVERYSH